MVTYLEDCGGDLAPELQVVAYLEDCGGDLAPEMLVVAYKCLGLCFHRLI